MNYFTLFALRVNTARACTYICKSIKHWQKLFLEAKVLPYCAIVWNMVPLTSTGETKLLNFFLFSCPYILNSLLFSIPFYLPVPNLYTFSFWIFIGCVVFIVLPCLSHKTFFPFAVFASAAKIVNFLSSFGGKLSWCFSYKYIFLRRELSTYVTTNTHTQQRHKNG